MASNVALVFGASGISGWALTNSLLSYPSLTTFSRIIALTKRPLSLESSRLPSDPRIELYSGINLRGTLRDVLSQIQKIPNLNQVTHMYYCAYSNATAYTERVMDIKDINVGMTFNAVHAVDKLCSNLKFVVLQTGTNSYGVAVLRHKYQIEIKPPLREEQPRIPSPYGDEIFYYGQVDLLREAAKGKSWGWSEVRPDAIVGFVPNSITMNYVEPVALYLALYRYVNGADTTVPFPGTFNNFVYTRTTSSQDIITKAEIYLSVVKPDEANGEAFNIVDNDIPASWAMEWPILAGYFGLKGTHPVDDSWGGMETWWNEHQSEYRQMCREYMLQPRPISAESWVFLRATFVLLDRNREFSLDKIRVGFTDGLAVGQGYHIALNRMAKAGFIPKLDCLKAKI